MSDNIVLIGFMGVGKGQVGRALASYSTMYAVDCDDLIESLTNLKIKKIFAELGEERFRKYEKKTAKWLEKNVQNAIISTGGGFVNVPNLKKIGSIVYLHAEFDYILKKMQTHPNAAKKIKKRPLLQDRDKARKLYNERLPVYREAADLVIDVSDKDLQTIVKEIAQQFQIKSKKE